MTPNELHVQGVNYIAASNNDAPAQHNFNVHLNVDKSTADMQPVNGDPTSNYDVPTTSIPNVDETETAKSSNVDEVETAMNSLETVTHKDKVNLLEEAKTPPNPSPRDVMEEVVEIGNLSNVQGKS